MLIECNSKKVTFYLKKPNVNGVEKESSESPMSTHCFTHLPNDSCVHLPCSILLHALNTSCQSSSSHSYSCFLCGLLSKNGSSPKQYIVYLRTIPKVTLLMYSTEQSAQKKKLFSASSRIKSKPLYITFNALHCWVSISKLSCINYNLNI